jgi:hypothetical protein
MKVKASALSHLAAAAHSTNLVRRMWRVFKHSPEKEQ